MKIARNGKVQNGERRERDHASFSLLPLGRVTYQTISLAAPALKGLNLIAQGWRTSAYLGSAFRTGNPERVESLSERRDKNRHLILRPPKPHLPVVAAIEKVEIAALDRSAHDPRHCKTPRSHPKFYKKNACPLFSYMIKR